MKNIGRLPDDATIEQRLEKFTEIVLALHDYNIQMTDLRDSNPVLEDESCGFVLEHNADTWSVYTVEEVVMMIVMARNNFIDRKKIEMN